MQTIKVLIVEDHSSVRNALKAALSLERSIEIVGVASNCEEAVTLEQLLKPDVILLDLLMHGNNTLGAISKICSNNPDLPMLGLTGTLDPNIMQLALEAGLVDCVRKNISAKRLISTIQQAFSGSKIS
jgi:DNA-binding NarL/FixJ family response regulator